MAGELNISLTARYSKGVDAETFQASGFQVDVAGVGVERRTQSVPLTDTASIALGDVAVNGYAIFRNIEDATTTSNTEIKIGPSSAGALVPLISLKPGEFALMRLDSGIVPHVQSVGAIGQLMSMVFED